MNILDVIIKSLFVILLGYIIFFIDDREFVDTISTKILLLIFAFIKYSFFIFQSFKKILETTKKNVAYYKFLLFMGINILLIVFSFGIDFFCLNEADPTCFSGLNPEFNIQYRFFEFIYFSILNFTNVGFGVLMPQTIIAKVLVMMEVVLSFICIIFILSDFISLKESIIEMTVKKNAQEE